MAPPLEVPHRAFQRHPLSPDHELAACRSQGAFARVLRVKTPQTLLFALHNNAAAVYLKLSRLPEARDAA